jgi:hypothetical protein
VGRVNDVITRRTSADWRPARLNGLNFSQNFIRIDVGPRALLFAGFVGCVLFAGRACTARVTAAAAATAVSVGRNCVHLGRAGGLAGQARAPFRRPFLRTLARTGRDECKRPAS